MPYLWFFSQSKLISMLYKGRAHKIKWFQSFIIFFSRSGLPSVSERNRCFLVPGDKRYLKSKLWLSGSRQFENEILIFPAFPNSELDRQELIWINNRWIGPIMPKTGLFAVQCVWITGWRHCKVQKFILRLGQLKRYFHDANLVPSLTLTCINMMHIAPIKESRKSYFVYNLHLFNSYPHFLRFICFKTPPPPLLCPPLPVLYFLYAAPAKIINFILLFHYRSWRKTYIQESRSLARGLFWMAAS